MDHNQPTQNEVSPTAGDDTGKVSTDQPAPSHKVERTEKEKAEFTLKMNAKRVRELGGDPTKVLSPSDELPDEDKPLTLGDLARIEKQKASQSAMEMAKTLPESERDEVITLLESRIVPSGNADEDLRLARAAVNAQHNAKIVEEISRRPDVKRTAAGGSQSAPVEEPFTPTEDEKVFMGPPYNLSKEKIIEKRKAAAQ